MPLYEVFCLTRPTLTRPELVELIKRSCTTVLNSRGVVTKVVSNGTITLAHKIKKTHGHYEEAHAWSLGFHAAPSLLSDISHNLATDEKVLRYQVSKYRDVAKIRQWRAMMQYGSSDPVARDKASQWQ